MALILGVVAGQLVAPSQAQAYRNRDVADELHYKCYHCGAEYTKVYKADKRVYSGNVNEFDNGTSLQASNHLQHEKSTRHGQSVRLASAEFFCGSQRFFGASSKVITSSTNFRAADSDMTACFSFAEISARSDFNCGSSLPEDAKYLQSHKKTCDFGRGKFFASTFLRRVE